MALKSALVLDDDAPFRRLLREALLTDGWSVRCAARNEAALHIAALRRPDVVLLDVSKPDFAPEAVAAGLRIHYGPQLPILATSVIPQPEIITRIGAFGFLQKPFEIDRLLSLLERGLALSERASRLRAHSDAALDRIRYLRGLRPLD